jgi:hypothetical protein
MVNYLQGIEAAMHLDGEIGATQDSKLGWLLQSSLSYYYISDLVIFDLVHMTIRGFSHSPIVVTASRTRLRTMGSPHARPVHPAPPRFSMPACKARHGKMGHSHASLRSPTSPDGRLGSCKCSEREPSILTSITMLINALLPLSQKFQHNPWSLGTPAALGL